MIKINSKTNEVLKWDALDEDELWVESNIGYEKMHLFISPIYDPLTKTIKEGNLQGLLEKKNIILRQQRDNLLVRTIWLMQRHQGEKEGIEYNIGRKKKTTLTEEEYKSWLEYWELLRDLPDTYNLNDNSIEDIMQYKDFPKMPSGLEL